MKQKLFYVLVAIGLVTYGCELFDLEEVEFTNYQKRLPITPAPGLFFPYGMIQNSLSEYLVAGSTPDSLLLISRINEAGEIISTVTQGPGRGHDIIRANDTREVYVVAGNEGKDCFALKVDSTGSIVFNKLYYKDTINRILGLVDFIQIYSIALKADGGYVATGQIKQTIGGSRLCHILLDNELRFVMVKTSQAGMVGTRIKMEFDGHHTVSGIAGDKAFAARFDQSLNLIRHRVLPNSKAIFFSGIARNSNNQYLLPYALSQTNDSLGVALFSQDLNTRQDFVIPVTSGLEKTEVFNIAPTRDGSFLILGSFKLPGFNPKVFFMKVDTSGKRDWLESFEGDFNTHPLEIFQAKDLGFTALSLAKEANGQNYVFLLLKTDERGKTR